MSFHRTFDDSLFAPGEELALAGSRCARCSTVTFPPQESCPRCTSVDVERHTLATEGSLWAFTEQLFPPKPPYVLQGEDFRPYVVGYVDLGGEVLVESRIVTDNPSGLRIGQRVQLITEVLTPEGDVTFAFTPSDEGSR